MATRTFADLSSYRKAVDESKRTSDLLNSVIGGLQQGVQLGQLPQTLQDQALARQLNNALIQQKLADLQNPQQALVREAQKIALKEAITDPNSGIVQTPVGLVGETIATPSAIPQTAITLDQAIAGNPTMAIPTAAAGLPITPIGTGALQTGFSIDQNVPIEAERRKTDELIRKINATPVRTILTKEGYSYNPVTKTLEAPLIPGDTTLPEQLRSQKVQDATSKTDASKALAETKAASQKELQEDQQSFVAEQNEKNRLNRLSLADKRAKLTTPGEISPYQAERQTRVLDSVNDLEKDVGYDTVGFADWFKGIPTSAAREFAGKLKTLKAAIAFGELTAMREASKRGGALGQVSNIELGLLESALGNLDQAQSPSEFKGELQKVRDSINRWQSAVGKPATTGGGPVKVNTKAERDALKPGTVYISPSGSISTR